MKNIVLIVCSILLYADVYSQVKFVSKAEFDDNSKIEIINSEEEKSLLIKEGIRFSKYLVLEAKKNHVLFKDAFKNSDFSQYANAGIKSLVNERGEVIDTKIMVSTLKIDSLKIKFEHIEVSNLTVAQKKLLINTVSQALICFQPNLNLNRKFYIGSNTNLFAIYMQKDVDVIEILAKKSRKDTVLVLNNMNLTSIPESVYEFKNLKTLNLSNNYIEKLNLDIKKFPHLENLILNDNLLTVNSIKIKRNKKLRMLNLSNNVLVSIPKGLQKNRNLEEITLANNAINDFGKFKYRRYKKLKMLNLYQNNLKEVPAKIALLKKLETLDLYYNNLKVLPDNISNLKNLQTLAVSNNYLWALPKSLGKLESLKILYLHHNKVTTLPILPPNLELLDFGYNLVENLPQDLDKLDNLKELDFSNNKISGNFGWLLKMKGLQTVYLSNNLDNEKKAEEIKQIIVDLEKKSIKVK